MLDSIDQLTAQIAVLDEKIAVMCEPYERQAAQLDGIPGFGVTTAQDLIAEIGLDMSVFPTAGHLASWARRTPRVTESAGKRKGKNATGRGSPCIGGAPGESVSSSVTLRWADRRSLRLVSSANQRSTRFIQLELVGVKCRWKRGCLSSHWWIAGVLRVA
jgi:Transposase IS116/IS110/IS902 family